MSSTPRKKNFIVISQVFPPDAAAVGTYMLEAAAEMQSRGYQTKVYTANRGYEDPSIRYLPSEVIAGVRIKRLSFSSFGKKSILTRLIGTISFMTQVFFIVLCAGNTGGILFSTSPPLIGFVISIAAFIRRIPTAYWAMDLNPDQLIALKKIGPKSFIARMLEFVNRFILRRTSLIIALDRFMADRLRERKNLDHKIVVVPVWPQMQFITDKDHSTKNPFIEKYNLQGKFVVMYSGNHSPSNPINTLLQSTLAFKDDPRIIFAFVGGGLSKKDVEAHIAEHQRTNVLSIPYQPLSELKYSVSAATVYAVTLGDAMVGIVHPCKIYNIMGIARPMIYFGPSPSHISDILDDHDIGWQVRHGDVEQTITILRQMADMPAAELQSKGDHGRSLLDAHLSQEKLRTDFCNAIEKFLKLSHD